MRQILIPLLCVALGHSADEQVIFDGKTLAGWEGTAGQWRVEDGAITGEIPAGQSLKNNEFIYWQGEVRDFELTVEYRITGNPGANSGIQIRSKRQPDGHAVGLQADLDDGATWLGRIYDEHGRALIGERGCLVSIAPDGRRWVDALVKPETFRTVPKPNDWNTYRITASASHIETWVNGVRFLALDDHQADAADYAGKLAFQLHSGGGPAKVQFRNVRLRDLGATQPPDFGTVATAKPEASAGIRPLGEDGKPLNLDFENGTIDGWTATGDAWKEQPIKGDTVTPRKPGQASRHAGQFWIGGYERAGDQATGTLTSPAFTVAHPWASMLVGGGKDPKAVRAELIEDEGGKVIHTAVGPDHEDMQRVAVDLSASKGKRIRIRLVDESAGGWGHLNFDDFVFHQQKPGFAKAAPTAAAGGRVNESPVLWHLRPNPAKPSAVDNAGAQKLLAEMTLTSGFQADLIAADPLVRQPIAFAIDERGRLWVAEGHSYPNKQPEGKGKDRITVFADNDGDGAFETNTVFIEGLNLVSGLEVGFGGVWVGAAPHLMFIPDRDGDAKPDGAPEIVLDGWGHQDTHETLNSFTWGPDGWLYGNQGVFTASKVGKPGTPDGERVPIRAGVWRFHPVRREFEIFAHGGSNQWGIDFNSVGHAFMTHCRSFWGGGGTSYVIRNGHYWNQVNGGYAPFIANQAPGWAPELKNFLMASARYDDGEGGAGKPGSGAIYGGHAHVATLIYQGDNWPEIYRDHVFTFNLFGQQLNHQHSVRAGSAYETFHGGYDLLHSSDPLWIPVDLQSGPDGAAYIIDWTDRQHCHTPRDENWDRSNGRIYRLSWAATWKPAKVDLGKHSDAELVALHAHRNEWYVRTARRLLQQRAAEGKLDAKALAPLAQQARAADPVTVLRAAWTLHVTGNLDHAGLTAMLAHDDDRVRAWAIALGTEQAKKPGLPAGTLVKSAASDPSAMVRLAIASALPTLAAEDRWEVAGTLAAHGEDANDRFVPKLVWSGIAPLMPGDPARALRLANASKQPTVSDSTAWYLARSAQGRDQLAALLAKEPEERAGRVLRLLATSLENEARLVMPAGWAEVAKRFAASADGDLRGLADRMSAAFGDETVLTRMRVTLADEQAPLADRQRAFELLKRANDRVAMPTYVKLIDHDAFRNGVIPLLAGCDDPAAATGLLRHFAKLGEKERTSALETLTSNPALAAPLLRAIQDQAFERKELTALHVRALRNLKNDEVGQLVDKIFGKLNESPAAAKATMARLKKTFSEAPLWAYDSNVGKQVYQRTCSACHAWNGTGGALGPDLAGTWRNGIDYFIENIVDPNAVVGESFQLNLITKKDGTVISGMVEAQTDSALIVRTVAEKITVPKDQIQARQVMPTSMMPPGLLETLPEAEAIALLKFLTSK